ncbi:hypothetical protein Tco_1155187 [Tanacetum coccineum]
MSDLYLGVVDNTYSGGNGGGGCFTWRLLFYLLARVANILPRLQELATVEKSTMMVDQVLVLMEKEIDKELKLEEKLEASVPR